tara:strand:+ start:587 stop:784 length:198 start_codon:yes stop_codon:yes gene_type:complete
MGVNKDELVRLMAEGTLHSSVRLLKRESKELKDCVDSRLDVLEIEMRLRSISFLCQSILSDLGED